MPLPPLTLCCHRSLARLGVLERGEVLKLATDLCDVDWVRDAMIFGPENAVTLLGRFDVTGPDRHTPYPAVLVQVRRRPRHKGQADRTAYVALYLTPENAWNVSTQEDGEPPWDRYRGDREGEKSVLNGDVPGTIPPETT